MVSLFRVRQNPAGRELRPSDRSLPNHTPVSDAGRSSSTLNDPEPRDVPPAGGDPYYIVTPRQEPPIQVQPAFSPNPSLPQPGTQGSAPVLPLQPGSGFFPPSLASNGPNPAPTNLPGSSSTTVSTSSLPVSRTVTLSTSTPYPTPTALLAQGKTSSSGLSTKDKYIIGGAAGGGGLVLILLALLLLCLRKRRSKRDLERTGDGHPEHTGHGQFTSCNHGACSMQTPIGQGTPLKPFVLKIDPAPLTTKEDRQQHAVSLNRRDSTGSQKSAGSDTGSGDSACSTDGSTRRRKGEQKRPPPLKLTSLVTPVINGPQHNPRDKNRSPLQGPPELPRIVVDPPQSESPERPKNH